MKRHIMSNIYETKAFGETFVLPTNSRFEIIESPGKKIAIPLIITEISHGIKSAESPYGYSGVIIDGETAPEDLDKDWVKLVTELREQNIVHLKLKLPPFDESQKNKLTSFRDLKLHSVSETVWVPVESYETNWANLAGRSRTAIRKAIKEGLSAEISPVLPVDLEDGSPFRKLYDNTMSRKKATDFYHFDRLYFRKLLEGLGEHLQKILVRDKNEHTVAASLIMFDEENAHYHLSGSTLEGAKVGANNLMIWSLIEYCQRIGVTGMHLGGGMRGRDSLFKFKQSFGGTALPFVIGTSVLLPEIYSQLNKERAAELGVSVARLESSGYFPAFRTPPDEIFRDEE